MVTFINLYGNKKGEINRFLSKFYNTNLGLQDSLSWEKEYINPVEMCDLIGAYIDNIDVFPLRMWICLDKHIYINITEENGNSVIQYLYERFPY